MPVGVALAVLTRADQKCRFEKLTLVEGRRWLGGCSCPSLGATSSMVWRTPPSAGRAHDRSAGVVVLQFGIPLPGVSYVDRPGAYAIIRDRSDAIALVRTPQGLLLPGGGVEPHEDILDALQREIIEELGYRCRIGSEVCAAVQYMYSQADHEYFRKVGRFFTAILTSRVGAPTELDHELVWCPPEDAVVKLAQEFQVWAVRQACRFPPPA